MPTITTVNFEPPNDSGVFFDVAPRQGATRLYHGTSTWFSDVIEQQGFKLNHRFLTDSELEAVNKHAASMKSLGPEWVWTLGESRRFSLTRFSRQALRYACSSLKGGVYCKLLDDLDNLTRAAQENEMTDSDRAMLGTIRHRLEPISRLPGVVYAIDLYESEVVQLTPPGDPTYAPFDIPVDRITYRMLVPVGYEDR